jgi:hypothetical protein
MGRSQAAIEFLLTYGWVILMVLIIISLFVVYYKPSGCPANMVYASDGLVIIDQIVTGMNSAIAPAGNLFYFKLRYPLPQGVMIKGVSMSRQGKGCGSVSGITVPLFQNDETRYIVGRITNPECMSNINSCYKFDLAINYTKSDSNLIHTASGTIGGSYMPGIALWALGNTWGAIGITGSVLTMQNLNNQKINFCNPATPPTPASYTQALPGSIITWSSPPACDMSVSQVGFGPASCANPSTQLAQGWIHNTVYIDPVFEGYTFFIGGNGRYYDDLNHEWVDNGICMNDNMYIYVNGVMKLYGGTTGVMVAPDNQYDTGDQVMRNCGNCDVVDPSAWCIPPLELNTNGFIFGQSNNIDILVEDYCGGGGMSPLSLQLA